MNLSAPFIKRPIATTLLAIGLAIAGLIAFNILPVSPLPQVDFPTIMVQATLPGASPQNMATSIATPLERQLGRIAGLTEMTSSSSLSQTRITLQFDLSRDIDGAARDVQAAMNAAASQLPANLPSNPQYKKVNPADAPIMIISLTSPIYSVGQMYDYASTILQQRISQINGVGQVNVGGGSLPAIRVELNPTKLNSYNISLGDVRSAIASANTNLAKGQLTVDDKTSQIILNDQLFKAAQYKPLIITYRQGRAVRLEDVADVIDSTQDIRNAGIANGKPAVVLILFKEPGANIISTVDQVNAILPQLKASIPAAINMTVMLDRTTTIRTSLHDVEFTLVAAMLLVILVTYIFLDSLRAMLIPAVAVPLSLLGTFGVMQFLGYSLDNLSLMALTISTGFVVDDAVVVLENITRHSENGENIMQAAMLGAREIGFTVLSMSLSLIAVFTPILFMGGIIGRLFREFAMTLSIAILISMLVSLTVTPMMCAYLLKKHNPNHEDPKFESKLQRLFQIVQYHYATTLKWALKHSTLMIVLTCATIALNILLFIFIPKGFFPQQDTGRIVGSIQADQNISFQAMKKKLAAYVNIIKQDPAVQNVAGYTGGNTTNTGFMFIALKPLAERKISSDQIINRLRPKVAHIPGASLFMQSAQDLMIGGRQGNAQFQFTLSANNLDDLDTWTPLVMQKIAKIPGIVDVNSDQRDHGLQVYVNVDRNSAARYGLTSQVIDSTLYNAFGQAQVSTMYMPMNQYRVVMEVAPPYWQRPETLNNLYVPTPQGKLVPLSAFSSFAPSNTLISVNHQGQGPAATISFNLLPGLALGDAVKRVTKAVSDIHLPSTIQSSFRGTAQAFQSSLASEPYLILTALLAVYIVLGMLYESLIHPITILSTLPSAGVGALLALIITHTDFSIIALIGIILLIGIVKKNAIMMIDFAIHAERVEKKNSFDAIYEAALLRFRPIMMTTVAAMFGALPLVFALGLGSELRQPLGIAIVGGLLVSQMLTLYTTPVIYLLMEKLKRSNRQ